MTKTIIAAFMAAAMTAGFAAPASADDVWNIKCFDNEGHTIAVKAIGEDGMTLAIKALPVAGTRHLDVKAITEDGSGTLPVKVVAPQGDTPYSDVKVIDGDNKLLPVKGITSTGATLDVKALPNAGTGEFDIKCLDADGGILGLKAISPSGEVYDVKGLAEVPNEEDLELEIEAHIKARPQQQ